MDLHGKTATSAVPGDAGSQLDTIQSQPVTASVNNNRKIFVDTLQAGTPVRPATHPLDLFLGFSCIPGPRLSSLKLQVTWVWLSSFFLGLRNARREGAPRFAFPGLSSGDSGRWTCI